jgi:hypothetical protein
LIMSIVTGMRWYAIVILIYISLISGVEHFLTCLGHMFIFFWNVYSSPLLTSKIRLLLSHAMHCKLLNNRGAGQ